MEIVTGETSVIRHILMLDNTATDGSGKTGVAFGSFTVYYVKPGGTLTALTPETISTLGTYAAPTANTNIRIKEVHATNAPGLYEVQYHNDMFATGRAVTIRFAATGGADVLQFIDIVDFNMQTANPSVNLVADQSAATVGTVNALANGSITAAVIATDAIDADALKADAVTEIQAGLATAAALTTVAGYIDAEIGQILGSVAGKKIVNAAGTQIQIYDRAAALLVTLDRTGTGPYTWTPTWA